LGADLNTARGGLLFAAFLKLLMPIIVVLPGIAAYVLYKEGKFQTEMLQDGSLNPDRAYPVLLNLLPAGLKGLSFAALTAAVVASLAGKANSIATIFTLDVYKKVFNRDATEQNLVRTGKVTIVVAMVLAVLIAPHLGIDKKGGFQYIQEYTGFVSPGIFAMFIMGFFWKGTTSAAALFATIGGFVMSILLKVLPKFSDLGRLSPWGLSVKNAAGVYEIPFIDRMGIVFVFCVIGMVIISKLLGRKDEVSKGLEIDAGMFKTTRGFAIGSLIVLGLLVALYGIYW
jgi:SSS family solute:Na+ symporter